MPADGVDAFRAHLRGLEAQGTPLRYERIHRVGGEGDFVFTQCEGAFGDERMAFYDVYRIEDGRIVEHWDVSQPVSASSLHDNGTF